MPILNRLVRRFSGSLLSRLLRAAYEDGFRDGHADAARLVRETSEGIARQFDELTNQGKEPIGRWARHPRHQPPRSAMRGYGRRSWRLAHCAAPFDLNSSSDILELAFR
jgi:hypothetical protein